MIDKGSKNYRRSEQEEYLKKSHIPRDNVLDLKKILSKEEKVEKKGILARFKGISLPQIFNGNWEIKLFGVKIIWRNVAVFSLVGLCLILPFLVAEGFAGINEVKGKVLGASAEALVNLKSGSLALSNLNINQASENFKEAENNFTVAQTEISKINSVLLTLVKIIPFKGKTVTSGQHLIMAGKEMAEIGQIISQQIKPLSANLQLKEGSLVIPEVLFNLSAGLDDISQRFKQVQNNLEKVETDSLPAEYSDEITKVKEILPALDEYFARAKQLFSLFSQLLGQDKTNEYLFVFQNNQEIRPTGGFIGSLALVQVEKGEVKILEVPGRGPYEINDDLTLDIIPPKPLMLVNNKWQIQDANWFPDFPTTAAKINWFYEMSRGFSVDGVISLTPDIIVDLLKITGPVTLDKYQVTLTCDNFIQETENQVEVEFNKAENRPKQMIADLIPILLNKILKTKPGDFLSVVQVFQKALQEKDILIYAKDEKLENDLKALNLAGEMKESLKDYLMVVNTNIGGGKTDGVIKQTVKHSAEIDADGYIIDTLTIQRSHQGDRNDPYTKIKNMDYLRIYVPEGAELLAASGFSKIDQNLILSPSDKAKNDADLLKVEKDPIIDEKSGTRITREFGKTCFANWLNVEVGEMVEGVLKYKLPFKISDPKEVYSLFIQKQPGVNNTFLEATLRVASEFNLVQEIPAEIMVNGEVKYQVIINTDKTYGVVLEKK